MPPSLFRPSSFGLLIRVLRWIPGHCAGRPRQQAHHRGSHRTRCAQASRQDASCASKATTAPITRYNANANRIAHWALERGIGKGDVVAVLMGNRPEYLEVWAGLAKVGATGALLNTDAHGASALSHVLEAARCKTLVLGSECIDAWASVGLSCVRLDLDVFVDAGSAPSPPALSRPAPRAWARRPPATATRTLCARCAPRCAAPTRSSTSTPRAPRASPRRRASATPASWAAASTASSRA